jgi:hypothetical protein
MTHLFQNSQQPMTMWTGHDQLVTKTEKISFILEKMRQKFAKNRKIIDDQ